VWDVIWCAVIREQETLSLRALLLHDDPIKSAAWDPTAQRIAIVTGTSKLFFWSADSAMCVDIPAEDFSANTLAWCTQRDGAQAIVLNDAMPNAAKQTSSNFFCVRTHARFHHPCTHAHCTHCALDRPADTKVTPPPPTPPTPSSISSLHVVFAYA
jgi:hypothetical protein